MTDTEKKPVSFLERLLRIWDWMLRLFGLLRASRREWQLEKARQDEANTLNTHWSKEFDKLTKKHGKTIQEMKEDFQSESTRRAKTHQENLDFESRLYQNEISKKEEEIQQLKLEIKRIQDLGVKAEKMTKGAEILIRDCVREVQNFQNEDAKKVQRFFNLAQRLEFLKDDLISEESLLR